MQNEKDIGTEYYEEKTLAKEELMLYRAGGEQGRFIDELVKMGIEVFNEYKRDHSYCPDTITVRVSIVCRQKKQL